MQSFYVHLVVYFDAVYSFHQNTYYLKLNLISSNFTVFPTYIFVKILLKMLTVMHFKKFFNHKPQIKFVNILKRLPKFLFDFYH